MEEKASDRGRGTVIPWGNWSEIFGYTCASKLHRSRGCPLARASGTAWLTFPRLPSFHLGTGWSVHTAWWAQSSSPMFLSSQTVS